MTTVFLLCVIHMALSGGALTAPHDSRNAYGLNQHCEVYPSAKDAAIANYQRPLRYASSSWSEYDADVVKLYRVDIEGKSMTEIAMPKIRLEVDEK